MEEPAIMQIYLAMVYSHIGKELPPTPPPTPERLNKEEQQLLDRDFDVATPSKEEFFNNPTLKRKRKYTPYKRLGHFREHLNRINFTQFIHLPPDCMSLIDTWLGEYEPAKIADLLHCRDIYTVIRKVLSKKGKSKYIEHIPYIIGYLRNKHHVGSTNIMKCTIPESDYKLLCAIFTELEKQYILDNINEAYARKKRFFSYYVVVQCLFTLLHIHPTFHLPVMTNKANKLAYYQTIYTLLAKTKLFSTVKALFEERTLTCSCKSADHSNLDSDCLFLLLTKCNML